MKSKQIFLTISIAMIVIIVAVILYFIFREGDNSGAVVPPAAGAGTGNKPATPQATSGSSAATGLTAVGIANPSLKWITNGLTGLFGGGNSTPATNTAYSAPDPQAQRGPLLPLTSNGTGNGVIQGTTPGTYYRVDLQDSSGNNVDVPCNQDGSTPVVSSVVPYAGTGTYNIPGL